MAINCSRLWLSTLVRFQHRMMTLDNVLSLWVKFRPMPIKMPFCTIITSCVTTVLHYWTIHAHIASNTSVKWVFVGSAPSWSSIRAASASHHYKIIVNHDAAWLTITIPVVHNQRWSTMVMSNRPRCAKAIGRPLREAPWGTLKGDENLRRFRGVIAA